MYYCNIGTRQRFSAAPWNDAVAFRDTELYCFERDTICSFRHILYFEKRVAMHYDV